MKKMQKVLALVLVIALAVLALAACGGNTPSTTAAPTTTKAPETKAPESQAPGTTEAPATEEVKVDPFRFSWGTSGSSTGGYIVAAGIADTINKAQNIFTADVEASQGQSENVRGIRDGVWHVGQGNNDGTYYYYTSTAAWQGDGADDIRDLFPLPSYVHHIVARTGSGIEKVEDIKGKKVAVGTAGSGYYTWSNTVLTALGYTFDDIEAVYIQPTQACESLQDGQIDCLMFANFMPWGTLTDTVTNTDVKFIPLGEEYVNKMKEVNPAYAPFTIPANTYPKQPEDIVTSSQQAMVWTLGEALTEDQAYLFVKTVFETYDDWKGVHDSCRFMNWDDPCAEMVVPLHIGAYKFYKEKGFNIPEAAIPPEAK